MAEATTIHKSQGSSYTRVTVQLPNRNERPLIYVALSRATTLNGLFLLGTFKPTLPDPNPRPVPKRGEKPRVYPNDEMCRLRNTALLETKFTKLCHVSNHCFQIVSHNICSLKSKIETVRKDTVFKASNLLLLQETWLKESDPDVFDIPDKVLIDRNRVPDSSSKGKGTIIFGDKELNITSLGHHDRSSGASVDITLCKHDHLYIINIYKSNNTSATQFNNVVFNHIRHYLAKDNVLVCGDFNDDLINPSNPTASVLNSYGLQLLSPLSATTDRGTIIDGVFGKLRNYNCEIFIYESYCSDHKPLVIRLTLKQNESTGLSQPLRLMNF